MVLVAYVMLIGLGAWIFPPRDNRFSFFGYVCALSALLVVICYATGEPPSWRWGDKR